MSEGPSSPKRVKIDPEELANLSKEDLITKLQEQNDHLKYLEMKRNPKSPDEGVEGPGKEPDKQKQQNLEAVRRENTLVMRLTNKEQELQDCMNQIQEMKASQTTSMAQLRTMLLDPAVNLVFQRISKEMEESKEKLKQTQNELSAWKFTPDSQTGKRLMVKCRMLLQENEELGKMIASGKTAKLEGEIALQKTLVMEMKKGQEEMDEFVADLEEDVEGMQSMIYVLQQQLKDTKEQLAQLQTENEQLRTNNTQSNGVSMETDNTEVLIETKSEIEQSMVHSNNSSPNSCPNSHPPPNHIKSNTVTTLTLQDSIPRSNNDIEDETNTPDTLNCSGNGDFVDNERKIEEPMETDNVQESKNEITHEDSETRTTNKTPEESNLKTLEITYDSSDTWSPQPVNIDVQPESPVANKPIVPCSPQPTNIEVQPDSPVANKTIVTEAQEKDIVSNGLETVTQSEMST